eukprot:1161757-Pelagomonas_calceolata.AAC.4
MVEGRGCGEGGDSKIAEHHVLLPYILLPGQSSKSAQLVAMIQILLLKHCSKSAHAAAGD